MTEKPSAVAPVVREYTIKGTRYIVTATSKEGVTQDAVAIIRRLINRDISGMAN